MSSYAGHGTRTTPQREPIPGAPQVANHEGGYVFAVDDWARLERFLILGSEGGSYYVGERTLTRENADVVRRCLDADGERTIETIVAVSTDGRAAKNDPAIFALAMASAHRDVETRQAALRAIPRVCRIGTHLFTYAALVEDFRGWGRSLRRGVAAWYEDTPIERLAYQAIKYRQRGGWSHRDLLRLSHPDALGDVDRKLMYEWIVTPRERNRDVVEAVRDNEALEHVALFERAQAAATPKDTAALVRESKGKLPREALRSEHIGTEVYEALVEQGMPTTALLRNLSNLGRSGVLKPLSAAARQVTEQLCDPDTIRFSRVHPLQVLSALRVYGAGGQALGVLSRGEPFEPLASVVDALDRAFYLSFKNVEPSNKRTMLALDVSASMSAGFQGAPGLDCATASAAMAMVTARTEPQHFITAFASGPEDGSGFGWRPANVAPFVPPDTWTLNAPSRGAGFGLSNSISSVPISPSERLDDVIAKMDGLAMGGTDCALPMLYAAEREIEVDVFCVYTDAETWAGVVHPKQALDEYRRKMGIPARLIVVAMVPNEFSIADPNDAGMLDVVGFDTSAPALISEFAAGRI